MSFSDGNFGARVLGAAGPSVTQYATVAELITASQGSLAEGYYEVPGVWVTFWNGEIFSPPYSISVPSIIDGLQPGVEFTNINPDSSPDVPNMFDDFELS